MEHARQYLMIKDENDKITWIMIILSTSYVYHRLLFAGQLRIQTCKEYDIK